MTAVGFNDVERSPAAAGSAWFDAQVGVHVVYATAAGHGVIDREL
jgi:hypothetical protein